MNFNDFFFNAPDLKSRAESLFNIKFPISKDEFLKARKKLLFKYHGDKAGKSDTAKFTEVMEVSKQVIENLENLNSSKTDYKPFNKGSSAFDNWQNSYYETKKHEEKQNFTEWWRNYQAKEDPNISKPRNHEKCKVCGGRGEVNISACNICHGSGQVFVKGPDNKYGWVKCSTCEGSGFKKISKWEICPDCLGDGIDHSA
jgi:DnaJ-class molecular chaperone